MKLTTTYELYTAITNVIILFTSLICFVKAKDKKLWKLFYLLVSVAGLMGIIIHGIVLSKQTIKILWLILSFIFSLIINLLLLIFLNNDKFKIKHVFLLSTLIYIVFFIELLCKIDFIPTFIIYAALAIILIFYLIYKNKFNKLYILGLIAQFIGGSFRFFPKFHIYYLDRNGIYHLFMIFTLIIFFIANKKEVKLNNFLF